MKAKSILVKSFCFNIALLTSLASAQGMPITDMGEFVNNKILNTVPTSLPGGTASDVLYSSIVAGNSSSPFSVTIDGSDYYYDVLDADGNALSSMNVEPTGALSGDYFGNYYNLGVRGDFGVFFVLPSDTVGNIKGDFINNIGDNGAGIMNFGTISSIEGNFIGNKVYNFGSAEGGGIRNAGTIGTITGDFIANYSEKNGAGIKNDSGTIGSISADFIGNTTYLDGAAIYNGTNDSGSYGIEKLSGTFIGNAAGRNGGAIFNEGFFSTIGDVFGIFVQNEAGQSGGAIYNGLKLSSLNGLFAYNSALNLGGDASGGAIYNDSRFDGLSGLFLGNSAVASAGNTALGGAIYNSNYLYMVANNGLTLFQGNYVSNDGGATQISNAIYNTNTININTGYDATDYNTPKKGAGMVHIKDDITGSNGNITINFNTIPTNGIVMIDGNVSGNRLSTLGGYLSFADGKIDEHYTGDRFRLMFGATLYMDVDMANSTIDKIRTPELVVDNSTVAFRMLSDSANALNELYYEDVTNLTLSGVSYSNAYTNKGKYEYAIGTGISQTATYTGMEGFKAALTQAGNRTFSLTDDLVLTEDHQTYAEGNLTIFGNISDKDLVVFDTNSGTWGFNSSVNWDDYHKITSGDQFSLMDAWQLNSSVNLFDVVLDGLANPDGFMVSNQVAVQFSMPTNVYNSAILNNPLGGITNSGVLNVFNSYFENTGSEPSTTPGAVLTRSGGITNVYNSVFVNNDYSLTNSATTNIYNSVFIGANEREISNTATMNIYAINGNTIIGDENSATGLRTQGSNTYLRAKNGTISINARSFGNSMVLGRLYIGVDDADGNSYDGTVLLNADMSDLPDTTIFTNGTLKIGANMGRDENTGYTNFLGGLFTSNGNGIFDSQNGVMDRFDLTNWTLNNPLETLIDIDLDSGESDFFDNATGKDIEIAGIKIINPQALKPDTEIAIASAGNSLTLGSGAKNVLSSIFKYTVDDTDLQTDGFLSLTSNPELATGFTAMALAGSNARMGYLSDMIDVSGIVLSPNRVDLSDLRCYGCNSFVSAWTHFSGGKEKLKSSDISVDDQSFIGLVGVDMLGKDIFDFDVLYSVYSGYIDSKQELDNVKTDQNGFVAGVMMTMNNGAVTNAVTSNFMTSTVKELSALGESEYGLSSVSVANKTGYDFKLNSERMTLTPSVQFGYHYVWGDDYTNVEGVKIKSNAMHLFNVTPELKLAYDVGGFKPYAIVGYNWNVTVEGDVTANDILLPMLTIGNYAKASVGFDVLMSDSFSGYAQINATTSEREGIGGQIGLKWVF